LHKEQIVYRDLKPENIMLSIQRGGHLKFVDYGFAKMLNGGKTYTNCGTAVYIAPEILIGEAYDTRIDIWSLGVLICELISG
jgi:protein kinase A